MLPAKHPSVSRRGFLATMAATGAAVSVLALSAWKAEAAAQTIGENTMPDQMVLTRTQDPNPPTIAPQPANPFAAGITRKEVQRSASSIPGREIVQVLTEIPAGVASGWHIHPGEEVGYILAGTVEMRVEGQPTRTLHAGDGFLIPPRTPHNAFDVGPEVGLMLSTYIVDATEPLVTLTG